MLTVEKLKEMEPGVFAWGMFQNSPLGIHMTDIRPGDPLLWVAVRGQVHDWAMYCDWFVDSVAVSNQIPNVASHGNKLHSGHAQRLLVCENDAAALYRR